MTKTKWICTLGVIAAMTWTLPALQAQELAIEDAEGRFLPDAGEKPEVPTKIRLQPKTDHEADLEIALDMRVEIDVIDNAQLLTVTSRIPERSASILQVTPDLESGTYTASHRITDRRTLELEGLMSSFPDRAPAPPEGIIFTNSCFYVDVLVRVHTGSAVIIRSSTATSLDWRFTDDGGGYRCIDVLSFSKQCFPAFGMSNSSCTGSSSHNGVSIASAHSSGSYSGTPPGSSTIGITDSTHITVVRSFVHASTTAVIDPENEPMAVFQIYDTGSFTCPFTALRAPEEDEEQ